MAPELQRSIAEIQGPVLPDLDRSLWDMLVSTATKFPDAEAVVSLLQTPHELQLSRSNGVNGTSEGSTPGEVKQHIRWSYFELVQRVQSMSKWLKDRGCGKGKHLVVFLWNSAEWVLFLWVAARLKMTFIPLDPQSVDSTTTDFIAATNPYVIVVPDEAAVKSLQQSKSGLFQSANIQISSTSLPEHLREDWEQLPELLCSLPRDDAIHSLEEGASPGEDIAMILYTSGTTSTPKGCIYTASNLWSQTFDFDPIALKKGALNRTLIHTPIWHSFAVNQALRGLREGNAIVIPSEKFDVLASLRALQNESITHMAVVPTLARALVAHPAFPGRDALNLSYVSIGGTLIEESDIKFCKEKLGSDAVIQGFGLTEGIPAASWVRNDPLLQNDFHPGVGKALPGVNIRICPPGSRLPAQRNEVGELHIGGTTVISRYHGDVERDSFYTDEVGSWFTTGDQARLDEDGVLYILGRYKDLIIRGGKNLAPAKIELCLQKSCGVIAQVVGIPDAIAGEVPVAVIMQQGSSVPKADMSKAVEQQLGKEYALSAIVTLEELGLPTFPLTAVGKVRKNILREHTVAFLTPPAEANANESEQTMVGVLTQIWADLLNLTPQDISPTDPVLMLGDSITLLRFGERVWKKVGKRLYLSDFTDSQTVEQQAILLLNRASEEEDTSSTGQGPDAQIQSLQGLGLGHGSAGGRASPSDPPSLADIAQANGDPRMYQQIKESTNAVLSDYGLSWDVDVEDVIPIKDSMLTYARGLRPQSYQHRIAYEIPHHSIEAVKAALEKGLSTRPMFRTLLVVVSERSMFHVVIRPNKTFMGRLVTERNAANHEAVREQLDADKPGDFSASQMFRGSVGLIEETATPYILLSYSHSVFDAFSIISWYTDLDRLISDPLVRMRPQTPFKLWADMAHQYGNSFFANVSIAFNANRLRGISKYPDALWPRQRSPGWMIGSDEGSLLYDARAESRKLHNLTRAPHSRLFRIRSYPQMEYLRRERGIPASLVVKTAVALFSCQQTGQDRAFFSNLEAGRIWPFVPAWMENHLPPAMSIDGPTLTWTTNMIRVDPAETCGALLQRIKEDQEQLSAHAHAPLYKVAEALGDEGAFMIDAARRQAFNWDLSLRFLNAAQEDHTSLRVLDRRDWPDCGFFWNCGMVTADKLCVAVSWDDAQVHVQDANDHLFSLLEIVGRLVETDNWDQPVGQVWNAMNVTTGATVGNGVGGK